jgi:hypothetical protein
MTKHQECACTYHPLYLVFLQQVKRFVLGPVVSVGCTREAFVIVPASSLEKKIVEELIGVIHVMILQERGVIDRRNNLAFNSSLQC